MHQVCIFSFVCNEGTQTNAYLYSLSLIQRHVRYLGWAGGSPCLSISIGGTRVLILTCIHAGKNTWY